MRKLQTTILILLTLSSITYPGDKRVLLELLTNAHCFSCVSAYEFFKQFRSTSPVSSSVSYIFYHVTQPGVEDSIYYENKIESDMRNVYYGSIIAAPILFVDGLFAGSNPKTWQNAIEVAAAAPSPMTMMLSGKVSGNTVTISTTISQTGDLFYDDLRLHLVATEHVTGYIGKNGVTPQTYAMRKMINGGEGEPLTMTKGETKTIVRSFTRQLHWNPEGLWVTAFVQSKSKRSVVQSSMMSVTLFTVTNVSPPASVPETFVLRQNFPNPFNPSTIIEFQLPQSEHVSLTVHDPLGREIASLVNQTLPEGNHSYTFDANRLPSGVYLYKLQQKNGSHARKMLLIR